MHRTIVIYGVCHFTTSQTVSITKLKASSPMMITSATETVCCRSSSTELTGNRSDQEKPIIGIFLWEDQVCFYKHSPTRLANYVILVASFRMWLNMVLCKLVSWSQIWRGGILLNAWRYCQYSWNVDRLPMVSLKYACNYHLRTS